MEGGIYEWLPTIKTAISHSPSIETIRELGSGSIKKMRLFSVRSVLQIITRAALETLVCGQYFIGRSHINNIYFDYYNAKRKEPTCSYTPT